MHRAPGRHEPTLFVEWPSVARMYRLHGPPLQKDSVLAVHLCILSFTRVFSLQRSPARSYASEVDLKFLELF